MLKQYHFKTIFQTVTDSWTDRRLATADTLIDIASQCLLSSSTL